MSTEIELLQADIVHLKDLLDKATKQHKVTLEDCANQVILAQQSFKLGNLEFVEVYLDIIKDKLTK